MVLQSLTVDNARFRAGSWRTRRDLAYLVPLSPAHTLTVQALGKARAELGARGFADVVTAAVAPAEKAALMRDGFVEHEHLHLLKHDLTGLPPAAGWWRRRTSSPSVERGRTADRPAVLELDARTFDDFWQLDGDGLDDAMDATPVSRLRVIRDPAIIGYAVAGRAGTQGFLQRLAVDPDRQGAGLGAMLVHDALHWMRRRGATVGWVNTQEANERALGLYRHLGFRPADHNLTVMARPVR
ncbi:MAG: GNAT family N-acetyltransferase [Acidimicrobiales bacterium]|nr:GNAT family N-acetyltransferase [Acidimicrobiales bacterium]